MLCFVASLVIAAPPANVEDWALRLANNAAALPSYGLANSAPQAYADDACRQIEAAVAKYGASPKLYRSLALVQEARGVYSEAADYAKLSDQPKNFASRIQEKQVAAAAVNDIAKSETALSVAKMRNKTRRNLWIALLCDPNKKVPFLLDNGSRYVASRLIVFSMAGGKAKLIASKPIKRELNETTLYSVDLDKDGNDEAVVDCLFYGASWTPSTFIVASSSKNGWTFNETGIFEEPGFVEDVDKDGVYELGGAQCIGEALNLSHAGQPRYPVIYRFEKGRLVNGDFHSKMSFKDILPELRRAKKVSTNDLELLSCEARALRVLGKDKEAAKSLAKAKKLSAKKAGLIWNGGVPWTVFRGE